MHFTYLITSRQFFRIIECTNISTIITNFIYSFDFFNYTHLKTHALCLRASTIFLNIIKLY